MAQAPPVTLIGQDGLTIASATNPLPMALDTATINVTAVISGSVALANSTATIGRTAYTATAGTLSSVILNHSALGTTTVVTGSGTTVINVYRMFFTNSTAGLVTFRNGTSLLTGDMTVGASGSITFDFDGEPWFTCGAGANFNISLSTTSQISGRLYYTQG